MSLELKLPIRDPREVIGAKSIGELPAYLDGEDRAVTRELLGIIKRAAGPHTVTVSQASELLESLPRAERKAWLDGLRRLCGLDSLEESRRKREAHMRGAPRHDGLRIGVMPGGALVDLDERDDDIRRADSEARLSQARSEARLAQAAVDAGSMDGHDEAELAELRRLLPEHMRRDLA